MTFIHIEDNALPDLTGKTALVTGGSSGIGLAAVKILASHGAQVYNLDVQPSIDKSFTSDLVTFFQCDLTKWAQLSSIFRTIGHLDMVFANAGIADDRAYFADEFELDDAGQALEPKYPVIDVNLRAVLNVVKLSWNMMKKQEGGGSIVLTASSVGYWPEHFLPVYSATKAAVIGLVRSLRMTLPQDNITINAVAPACTLTPVLPDSVRIPVLEAGLPLSTAEHVGMGLVYSATAQETRRVEKYGKDQDTGNDYKGRWNGRVILTLGDQYIELEESFADFHTACLGAETSRLMKAQQAATDSRPSLVSSQ